MKKIIALLLPSLTASFYKISPARRTVDGALVHFNKALDELRAVKAHNDKESAKQAEAALRAEQEAERVIQRAREQEEKTVAAAEAAMTAADAEAARAARTIAKIESLLA